MWIREGMTYWHCSFCKFKSLWSTDVEKHEFENHIDRLKSIMKQIKDGNLKKVNQEYYEQIKEAYSKDGWKKLCAF